ncbi:MAG: preprotein translocase subunit SecE, partial [Raoultibacter sp.]
KKMAKKSKTQRARASASRAAKKTQETEESTQAAQEVEVVEQKKKFFAKKTEAAPAEKTKPVETKQEKKAEKKVKKPNFLSEVRSELKRVTWPTKKDVLRWSVVVVVALVFFGGYVLVLDNLIVTPVLVGISSIGA